MIFLSDWHTVHWEGVRWVIGPAVMRITRGGPIAEVHSDLPRFDIYRQRVGDQLTY